MARKGKNNNVLPFLQLASINPLDGRYRNRIEELSKFVSEYALIKTRIEVEIKYLLALSEHKIIRPISKKEKEVLLSLVEKFDLKSAQKVKEIEKETRHDVKACERFLREFIKKTSMKDLVEMIHFGLTSEDINNISYRLILKRAVNKVLIPALQEINSSLRNTADKYKNLPMLARTHGQAAVPTTLGKEIAVYINRLKTQITKLTTSKLSGKLNGAVGNYNALELTYSKVNWIRFSQKFVLSFGFVPNLITTQISPYDDVSEFFQIFQRINNILIDLDQDVWRYISDGWFAQNVKKGEVGSSTMPQKVNPIDFENSEGNLGMANSILEFMSRKLMISRLQRDLSDSTVIRNIGTALGFSLVGYKSMITGLSRIRPNEEKISEDLDKDWSILTEAAQTILRKNGVKDSYYSILKNTRGRIFKEEDWLSLVNSLPIKRDDKKLLLKLTPGSYLGLSEKLTDIVTIRK